MYHLETKLKHDYSRDAKFKYSAFHCLHSSGKFTEDVSVV